MFGRCRGCEAKDGEIERLRTLNAALLDRVLAVNGQVPLPTPEKEIAPEKAAAEMECAGCDHPFMRHAYGKECQVVEDGESCICRRFRYAMNDPMIAIAQMDKEADAYLDALSVERGLPKEEFRDA